jgi:hypothetical protein
MQKKNKTILIISMAHIQSHQVIHTRPNKIFYNSLDQEEEMISKLEQVRETHYQLTFH